MAGTTPQMTSVREAIVAALEDIDGTGSYWNDASERVIEGAPDHKKMAHLPCIFVLIGGKTASGRNISKGFHDFEGSVTIWGCVESVTPFDDIEKLEQDIVRAIMANTGLGCAATHWSFESSEYDTDEIDRADGKLTIGVCKIETQITSRETFS
jgi:hypothetical protein